jgi:hypothetical protein
LSDLGGAERDRTVDLLNALGGSCARRLARFGPTIAISISAKDSKSGDEAMKTRYLLLIVALAFSVSALSANGESRQETGTAVQNPIIIESQIRDISFDGDAVIIHLFRQPYDIVADRELHVRTLDGRCMYARDLEPRDNIHLLGDLDHSVVYARSITLQLRVEHRGAD